MLSAGGLRGAAHLGVMRKLPGVRHSHRRHRRGERWRGCRRLLRCRRSDGRRAHRRRAGIQGTPPGGPQSRPASGDPQSRPASGDPKSRPASIVTAHVACAGLEWRHPAAIGPASSRPIRPAASRGQLSRGRVSRSDTSSATLPVYGFRWRRARSMRRSRRARRSPNLLPAAAGYLRRVLS